MPSGYVKVCRKFFTAMDPIWADGSPFDCRSAWLDLYQQAAWAACFRRVAGQVVRLKRGEFLASHRFLAERWAWGRNRVFGFLKDCQEMGRIMKCREVRAGTVYLIVNYDGYDEAELEDGTPTGPTAEPPARTPAGQHQDSGRTARGQSRSTKAGKQETNKTAAALVASRLTEACNEVLADRSDLPESFRPLRPVDQEQTVSAWIREDIDLELAERTIREKCRAFRATTGNPQPHSLAYFTSAIHERLEREQEHKASAAAAAEVAEAARHKIAAPPRRAAVPSRETDAVPRDQVPSVRELLSEFAPGLAPDGAARTKPQPTPSEKAQAYRQAAHQGGDRAIERAS